MVANLTFGWAPSATCCSARIKSAAAHSSRTCELIAGDISVRSSFDLIFCFPVDLNRHSIDVALDLFLGLSRRSADKGRSSSAIGWLCGSSASRKREIDMIVVAINEPRVEKSWEERRISRAAWELRLGDNCDESEWDGMAE